MEQRIFGCSGITSADADRIREGVRAAERRILAAFIRTCLTQADALDARTASDCLKGALWALDAPEEE